VDFEENEVWNVLDVALEARQAIRAATNVNV